MFRYIIPDKSGSHRSFLILSSFFFQENLTEALADLDAALEKELSRCNDELQIDGESSSKVEELEKQCKTLETELDTVKGK